MVIFEPAEQVGRGTAYRTLNDAHLLNIPVGRMNPVPSEPGHFLKWLRAVVPDATGGSFVPRRLFATYLEELLFRAAKLGTGRATLEVRRERVLRVRERDGVMELDPDGAPPLPAERVVLATGHLPPALPPGLTPSAARDRRFVADPWQPGWAARVPREAPVLLVGSGLTMIDAVLELRAAGHVGPLRAVSRHGLLPESHRGLSHDPVRLPPPAALEAMQPTTHGYLRAIRDAMDDATEAGRDWRDVMASLRPVTAPLWRRLPLRERARFLRHMRVWWDTHRHRSPPEVALRIAVLGAKRTLRITAARVQSIDANEAGLLVRLALRGGGAEEVVAGAVINCTGPDTDLSRADDPLVRSLLESGMIRQDPLRLGIETGEHGEVIGRDGAQSRTIYYVGPMLRACWWEATAVPELAEHAERSADRILEGLTAERLTGS